MRIGPVLRFTAYAHFGIATAMLPAALLSALAADGSLGGYVIGLFASVTVAVLCLSADRGYDPRPMVRNGLRELLLALVIAWTFLPLAASIPLMVDGETLGDAWFEAVSALTTTGGWLSDPIARSTAYDVIYRASLQWLGGLISLATAAAVFVRPEFIGVSTIVPPFARGESGSFLRAFDHAFRAFLPVYVGLTLGGGVAFVLVGVPVIDSFAMAMSLIATGGFIPAANGIGAYPDGAVYVAATMMLLGAVNFLLISGMLLGRARRLGAAGDKETLAFLAVLPFVALLFWVATGAGDLDRLGAQAFNAISLLSTNGPTLGEVPPLTPLLVSAVIGGAAVSTAGGIKILRWMVAIRRTGDELWRITHPGAVLGRPSEPNELGIWIHTMAFALLLAAVVLTVAFYGHSLEVSAATAVAVLANVGPIVEYAPLMTADYRIFDPSLRVLLVFAMISGRLELVVFLMMLSRRFWMG
ncbi:K+ transporter Trk [Parvularcula bermudensis HTCC2503]|uniref:K+ transporter Trk n=1 Tax=Parvularcula bermudensis (strain ATCC BAA-594 / HTCC2503 / KCTC 12087) TaxID=314260 RepID=E0TDY2_PARBH|nr:potassium transporter TrkG [Parvularcula bermudensis]ADM10431.1 K+ transporter Trk [Parvularcula bermudensis HTCC2503]